MEIAQFFLSHAGIMKTKRVLISYSIMGIILLVVSGCVQGNVTLLKPSESYPPSAKIEILKEKPKKAYKSIAVVRAVGQPSSTDSALLAVLQEKAKSIGADAILVFSKEEDDGVESCFGATVSGDKEKIPVLKAVAIKYN
jgi:hypothetical protein